MTVIFLTTSSTSPWTVPADWNSSDNSIETIGGGGGGGGPTTGSTSAGGGGGGGAYSKVTNLSLTPSGTAQFQVGTAGTAGNAATGGTGGDTWFNGASLGASSIGAKGGVGGASNHTNASGGAAASGIGTIKQSGGNGGAGNTGTNAAAGGGGAAGPNGDGKNGGATSSSFFGGSGGGGAGGGSATAGATPTGNSGSDGGKGQDNTAGGLGATTNASNGSAGSHGSGGGGGFGDNTTPGTNGGIGGNGIEFDSTHGAGGGGGGGGDGRSGVAAGNGAAGGSYGGGGGGGGFSSSSQGIGGAGGAGLIIITYTPIDPGATTARSQAQSRTIAILLGVTGGLSTTSSSRSASRVVVTEVSNTVSIEARAEARSSGSRPSLSLQTLLSAKSSSVSSSRAVIVGRVYFSARSSSISHARDKIDARTPISARSSARSQSATTRLDGLKVASEVTSDDPLWIALEIDLIQEVSNVAFTLRLGNRGSLQRTVGGTLYQYQPRLQTDIIIGTAISIAIDTAGTGTTTPFYQQPLRGQPNGGSISWIVDPSDGWYGISPSIIIGRTFRLYVGRTRQDVYADVDRDLTLVYTGHVVNHTFDITANPPISTIQTTDASSNLDKSLVDDLYPSNFPIVSLQGKPKPQLWGRKYSIQPTLEDQVSLTYRVTRVQAGVVGLDNVTNLTVGGVPWRRIGSIFNVDLSLSLNNLLAQYAALSGALQAVYTSVIVSDPANFNNGDGLQNKVNLVGLLTLYQGITASQKDDYQLAISANPAFYNNTPPGILNKIGLIKLRYYGLREGQWTVDIGNGTVQLGSDPGGADVRVDAQATGWGTLTTAGLITQIANSKGVPVNAASMAQLDLHWAAGVGLYTDTTDVSCLDMLDRITSSEVCWWALDETGAVKAGVFDIPDFRSDLIFIGSQPGIPLDINLLPPPSIVPIDPIPKEINNLAQAGVIQPAYRVRVGYAGRASPETAFLPGATAQEQADLSAPELVADWSPALGASGVYELSPSDGVAIRSVNHRAQDVYISSLCNTYTDALGIRSRLVQRVIGGIDHHLWTVNVRMDATKVKLMSSVGVMWIDENGKNRTVYSGNFRVTSAIMTLGSGPQQLELWGIGSVDANPRFSAFDAPPVAAIVAPVAISFTPLTVLSDAVDGNVIAGVSVTTSNGSTFNGSLAIVDDSGTVGINGNPVIGFTLVLARNLSDSDLGLHTVGVIVTESGITISQNYSFIVYAIAPGPSPPPIPPPPADGPPVIVITFTPPSPNIFLPVSNGDVVSIISAVWSDGTPFVGVFSFDSPNFDHGGDYAISGANLVVHNADNLNALASITAEHVTIIAIPTVIATLSISASPASPALTLPVHNGDVVAILTAAWSDGSPFTGTFSFGPPNFDHGGDYAISGSNLIINNANNLNAIGIVTTEHVTIMATQ